AGARAGGLESWSCRATARPRARARARAGGRPGRAANARARGARAPRLPRPRRRSLRTRAAGSCQFSLQYVGEVRERTSHAGLHGSQRDVEEARNLALRQAAPVRELDDLPLTLGQRLERAVYAPGD